MGVLLPLSDPDVYLMFIVCCAVAIAVTIYFIHRKL